jgi:GT2 family glycosyltransferase
MVLDPGFLAAGIAFLQDHPHHAAVGGRVREANTESIEFQLRAKNDRLKGSGVAGEVDRLDCGGLYRVDAVRETGYFADRNLHAFEEFELGARLRARGWRLARIDVPAVDHYGHSVGGYRLIWRRIRSGYAGAPGEVIRAAIGQRHWGQVLRHFSQLRNGGAVILWWLLLLACLLTGRWIALALLMAVPLAFLSWRRGSPTVGLYSLATWNMIAWGLVSGIVRRRVPPTRPLAAVELAAPAR